MWILWLMACGGGSEQPPPSCPPGTEPLPMERLGSHAGDTGVLGRDSGIGARGRYVIQDDASWEAYGAMGPVDFEHQVVFLNLWSDGGCSRKNPSYAACLDGDTVQMWFRPDVDGCDADIWVNDGLVVPRAGATRFEWRQQ